MMLSSPNPSPPWIQTEALVWKCLSTILLLAHFVQTTCGFVHPRPLEPIWPPPTRSRIAEAGIRSCSKLRFFFSATSNRHVAHCPGEEEGNDSSHSCSSINGKEQYHVMIMGKIIIDKYGDPSTAQSQNITNTPQHLDDRSTITIGGGGPQAAWGAAAALAVRDNLWPNSRDGGNPSRILEKKSQTLPPQQPVTFLAPIGTKNWTPDKAHALDELLLPVLQRPPILVKSQDHITPTINIWHDELEKVHWKPVNGSFGEEGAGGLWKDRPSANDILSAIEELDGFNGNIIFHSILESGCKPTGHGLDAMPLHNLELLNKTLAVGIEPIVFPNGETGKVSLEDSDAVRSLIRNVEQNFERCCKSMNSSKMFVVTPDKACYEAAFLDNDYLKKGDDNQDRADILWQTDNLFHKEVAVRDGANGSFTNKWQIPSATLCTPNGLAINPTGAGNAYSAAFVACRASGSSECDAATLASAVGAVVCEFEHLPPWTWDVLERIADAACEIRQNVHKLKAIEYNQEVQNMV